MNVLVVRLGKEKSTVPTEVYYLVWNADKVLKYFETSEIGKCSMILVKER